MSSGGIPARGHAPVGRSGPATRRVMVEQSTEHLRITRWWLTSNVIFTSMWFGGIAFMFALFGAHFLFLILLMIPIAPGAYLALAYLINRTTLEVSKERVVVRHGPLPWLGNKNLLSEHLAQVYVRRKVHGDQNAKWYTYDVFALMKNGARWKLMWRLGEDAAFQLEESIEDFLDIDDEEVWKFSAPRFKLAAISLLPFAYGVFLLAGVPVAFHQNIAAGVFTGTFGLVCLFFGAWKLYVTAFEDRRIVEDDLES